MSVSIRLSRGGSKKRPYYKIVVADARSPRDGRFIERIGSYNPLLAKDNPERVKLDTERAKHWVEVGAQPSDRVARFLDAAGVKERTPRNNPNKAVPGENAKERAEARATKAADDAEAAAAAAAAPAPEPTPEPVAEEAPAAVEAAAEPEAPAEVEPAEAVAEPVEAATTDASATAVPADGEGVSAEAPAEGAVEPAAETPQVESASAPAEGAVEAPASEDASATEAKTEG